MTTTRRAQSGSGALHSAMARGAALMAIASFALSCGASPASQKPVVASQATPKRSVSPPRPAAAVPVVTVPGTGTGQAGYIHYFVITGPDGEPESQVGIEMPGDRIAWSVPEMGVVISPFIRSGQITANGKLFEVEHLYGIRPLRDEEALRALQRDLAERVAWWVNEKTPYCDEEVPPNRLCVSCLGFVLRILYPGRFPAFPAMPADFKSAYKNIYTTEDLLMYLAGVPLDLPRDARLKRIAALKVPENMREQLVRIASADTAVENASISSDGPRAAVAKSRPAGRSIVKRSLSRRGS